MHSLELPVLLPSDCRRRRFNTRVHLTTKLQMFVHVLCNCIIIKLLLLLPPPGGIVIRQVCCLVGSLHGGYTRRDFLLLTFER